MKKIIKLTESDLTRIIKRVIMETEMTPNSFTGNTIAMAGDTSLSTLEIGKEVGSNIDPDVANEAMSCSFDEIGTGLNLKPEAKQLLDKVRSKIKDLVSRKDKGSIKLAFGKLKSQLKKNKPQEGAVNEQAALMTSFAILGITAPLWAWVAIGGVVLVLLIKGIIELTSWIPKKKGKGCSKRVTYRVR